MLSASSASGTREANRLGLIELLNKLQNARRYGREPTGAFAEPMP
jgi:hypothetical protein